MTLLSYGASGNALTGYTYTATGVTGDFYRLTRIDFSPGHYSTEAVRGADMQPVTSSSFVVVDYEAHFNTTTRYKLELFNLSNLVTPFESVTTENVDSPVVPSGFVMIHDVFNTAKRVSGSVSSLDTWDESARVLATHNVLGRRNPVVINDVEGGRQGTFKINTICSHPGVPWRLDVGTFNYGDSMLNDWSTIFRTGSTYLFRNQYYASGFDDCYFKIVNKVTSKRVMRFGQYARNSLVVMEYSFDFVEVDRPSTQLVGLGILGWQTLNDYNVNWTEVNAVHANWTHVLAHPDT